jgi:hypothetical protein
MGRTLQIVTPEKEELVCYIQKSTKALILEVSRRLFRHLLRGSMLSVCVQSRQVPTTSLRSSESQRCRVWCPASLFVSVNAGCSGCRVGDAD